MNVLMYACTIKEMESSHQKHPSHTFYLTRECELIRFKVNTCYKDYGRIKGRTCLLVY